MSTPKVSASKRQTRPAPKTPAAPRHPAPARFGKLPSWVIGAYDGPTDGKMSLRKGFAA